MTFILQIIQKKRQKMQSFMETKLCSLDFDFWLAYFRQILPLHTPWKHFSLMFLGGMKKKRWPEMNEFLRWQIIGFPSRHLLVQSQQWKHQSNVWNMFKVNNKDTRRSSLTSWLLTLNRFHKLFWYMVSRGFSSPPIKC